MVQWDKRPSKRRARNNVIPFSERASASRSLICALKWGLSLAAAIALVALGLKLFDYETFFGKPADRIAATEPSSSYQLMGPSGASESDSG